MSNPTLPGSIFPHFEVNARMPEPRAPAEAGLPARCTEIADQVVPEYRAGRYACTGLYAKRWQAAWDGACVALGGDPKRFISQVGERPCATS